MVIELRQLEAALNRLSKPLQIVMEYRDEFGNTVLKKTSPMNGCMISEGVTQNTLMLLGEDSNHCACSIEYIPEKSILTIQQIGELDHPEYVITTKAAVFSIT